MSERDDEVEELVDVQHRKACTCSSKQGCHVATIIRRAILVGMRSGSHRGAMDEIDAHSQSDRKAIEEAKAEAYADGLLAGRREGLNAVCPNCVASDRDYQKCDDELHPRYCGPGCPDNRVESIVDALGGDNHPATAVLLRRAVLAGQELGRQTWRHEYVSASKGEEWLAAMLAKAKTEAYADGLEARRKETVNHLLHAKPCSVPVLEQAIEGAKADGAREENETICGILMDWGVARSSIERIASRRKP